MHLYQRNGLYLWTKLQNARREGEILAYQSLASSSSSKHLATSEEIRVAYYNISKYFVTLPRDHFLDSLRGDNPRTIISITCLSIQYPVLVVSIGIQLQVSVTVGQAIDGCFLPCRGAPTYPPRSINSSQMIHRRRIYIFDCSMPIFYNFHTLLATFYTIFWD